jgi:hypothetical protein
MKMQKAPFGAFLENIDFCALPPDVAGILRW